MEQIGFSLIDQNGVELSFCGDTLGVMVNPGRVVWPNGDVSYGVSGPCEYMGWKWVPRMAQRGPQSIAYDGTQVIVTIPIAVAEVIAERERRLSLGFNYDFGDSRGVHRISTTASDMDGWDEVTKIAQAAINLSQPLMEITIVTETGSVSVTAMEWQSVLVAAAAFRQPIWAKSFSLQAMNPIPADYTSDAWWS